MTVMYNIAVPYLLSMIAFTINSAKRRVVVSIRSTQNEQIGRTCVHILFI